MHDVQLINTVISVIFLLFSATLLAFTLQKTQVPYTVSLVLLGLFVAYLGSHFELFTFIQGFRLSPELVLYIFLPTLIFESAFNMKIQDFRQNFVSISVLATVGYLISMVLIAWGMHSFFDFPWLIALLFGALISETDPVAILALFKRIGAPKRLTTLVEGESLFNDGASVVTFGILLELFISNEIFQAQDIFYSILSFGLIMGGGILVGVALGFISSKILEWVENSKEIEISVTLILAHFTFILAEYFLGVSGILATVSAGIVIGNYGAYKISPEVKETVTHFWDYTTFLANSFLFLLIGIMAFEIHDQFLPRLTDILLVIGLILLARAVMVYILLPLTHFFYPKEKVPFSWLHVVQWSGMRGALVLALFLILPETMPFYEELFIFTVSVIFFNIIFNGFTISPLVKVLGLKRFSMNDKFEYDENRALIHQKIEEKLGRMRKKNFISKDVFAEVWEEYQDFIKSQEESLKNTLLRSKSTLREEELKILIKNHLLGIERHTFEVLFHQGEITENLLNILLRNTDKQINLGSKKVKLGSLTLLSPEGLWVRFLSRIGFKSLKKKLQKKTIMLRYEMFRARLIATARVLETLQALKQTELYSKGTILSDFEKDYRKWHANAQKKLELLEKKDPQACHEIQILLARQATYTTEKKLLMELEENGMMSEKVYNRLQQDLAQRKKDITL